MNYYVFKLLPPRPTFMQDMTPDERALMQSHAVYLREWLEKGNLIVFGPVLDATGVYGLAVVRLEPTVDPASVWRGDPVIRANVGFRYEVAPMLSAVVPKAIAV